MLNITQATASLGNGTFELVLNYDHQVQFNNGVNNYFINNSSNIWNTSAATPNVSSIPQPA